MYIETVYIINHKKDTGNLDLWPSKLKNIRDRVLTKTNQHVEYKSNVINSNEQKKHVYTVFIKVTIATLTFDLVNPK